MLSIMECIPRLDSVLDKKKNSTLKKNYFEFKIVLFCIFQTKTIWETKLKL